MLGVEVKVGGNVGGMRVAVLVNVGAGDFVGVGVEVGVNVNVAVGVLDGCVVSVLVMVSSGRL
jgi:hypothetical protein